MKTKKHDFIELDFVASIKGGAVFDTTIREEAIRSGLIGKEDKSNEKEEERFKPARVCIGEDMVVKGLDKELEGKDIGEYVVELKPENAFGKREAKLIRTFSLNNFEEMPRPGGFVNVNGMIARVANVSGGRCLLDFNHPLAGKELVYKFHIKRIITDAKEKLDVVAKAFNLEFKLDEKKIIISKANKQLVEAFEKKLKELGLDFEIVLEKKEEKKEENK